MYDKATREHALELLRQGHTAHEVAIMMGGKPSRSVIYDWARGIIPSGKRRQRCQLLLAQKVSAVKRVNQGEDAYVIAEELGCSPATLLAWCRRYRVDGIEALRTKRDAPSA